MSVLSFKHRGDFKKTERLLQKALKSDYRYVLEKYGRKGVKALEMTTPIETGRTAASWGYKIMEKHDEISLIFLNNNLSQDWFNVAIGLRYGHATGNGGYVEGIDYLTPALRPIFQDMADAVWKEVSS